MVINHRVNCYWIRIISIRGPNRWNHLFLIRLGKQQTSSFEKKSKMNFSKQMRRKY